MRTLAALLLLVLQACLFEASKPVVTKLSNDEIVINITDQGQSHRNGNGCKSSPVDLVIVMDQSSSVGKNDFQKGLEAVAQLVQPLDIGPKQSRVGFVKFNQTAEEVFNLAKFTTKAALKENILKINCSMGGTNIGNGMDVGIKVFEKTPRNAVKVMLLITDGDVSGVKDLPHFQKLAASKNITIFVLGAGNVISESQLIAAAGAKDRVFRVPKFSDLINRFMLLTCNSKPELVTKPSANGQKKLDMNEHRRCACNMSNAWLDLIFVIDISEAVSHQDFKALSNVLAFMTKKMSISQQPGKHSRVALIVIAEAAVRVSDLRSYKSIAEARKAITRLSSQSKSLIRRAGGGRRVNIAAGLLEAQQMIEDQKRPNVPAVVVLFSSSEIMCYKVSEDDNVVEPMSGVEDPCRIAVRIKEGHNTLITVGLKLGVLKQFPKQNISTPCFHIDNRINMAAKLQRKICDANCFCLGEYQQFKTDESCEEYGECVYDINQPGPQEVALDTCNDEGGKLVNIFSAEKEEFMIKYQQRGEHIPFWIGLSNELWNGEIKPKSNDYKHWAEGHPQAPCTYVNVTNGEARWYSEECDDLDKPSWFSCQKDSCDTDNYCDFTTGFS